MINKEQHKILSQFEPHFKSAKLGYVRGVYSSDITVLAPIYNSLGYKLSNPNCSGCVLTMFKTLGEEYEKYNKRYGRKKQEGEQEDDI